MSTTQISEQKIDELLATLTEENFFEKVVELDPEDPDFVEDVKAAQEHLHQDITQRGIVPRFKVAAAKGYLVWHADGKIGRGPCPKTGAGAYNGSAFASGLQKGTFQLVFPDRFTANLSLSNGSAVPVTWAGKGAQKGISNRGGVPWTGTYA